MPCIMNGANELAVSAFLQGKIGFLEIADIVEAAMQNISCTDIKDCDDVLRADEKARQFVMGLNLYSG